MARLSVIIPALREAANIAKAIACAQQLGSPALPVVDVIVVDGGSDDGTPELARQAGATVIASPPGRGGQQNRGAQAAAGDVFLFLHADNRLAAAAGEQMAAALADPAVQAGVFWQRIDEPGWGYRLIEYGNALRARWLGTPFGDQGLFVRREAFESCGGFPNVPLLEDVYLARRLRRLGRFALLPGPLQVSGRRWRRRGIVRQTLRNWLILLLAALGVSPQRLTRLYPVDR